MSPDWNIMLAIIASEVIIVLLLCAAALMKYIVRS